MIKWKKPDELNKTGQIITLCQDNTGIYNQLMLVTIEKDKKLFWEAGALGSHHRVQNYNIKAAIYLDDLCNEDVIKQFCEVD